MHLEKPITEKCLLWLPNDATERVDGELHIDEDGTVTASLSQKLWSGDAFSEKETTLPILYGQTNKEPFTLLKSYVGSQTTVSFGGPQNYEVRCRTCLMGAHVLVAPRLQSVVLYPWGLGNWAGQFTGIRQDSRGEGPWRPGATYEAPKPLNFGKSNGASVELVSTASVSSSLGCYRTWSIEESVGLKISYVDEISIERCLRDVYMLQNFLTLATFHSVPLRKLEVQLAAGITGSCQMFYEGRIKNEPGGRLGNSDLIFNLKDIGAERCAKVIPKFLSLHGETASPALYQFFTVMHTPPAVLEWKMFGIGGAFERLHTDTYNVKKTFIKRVADIAAQNRFMFKSNEAVRYFCDQIKDGRNNAAHVRGDVLPPNTVWLIEFAKGVFASEILRQIGLDDELREKLILRHRATVEYGKRAGFL